MVSFEKCRAILKSYPDGTSLAKLDIQVSTAEELPAIETLFGNYKLGAGSIAQIIQAEELTYKTIDADGTWYPEQS